MDNEKLQVNNFEDMFAHLSCTPHILIQTHTQTHIFPYAHIIMLMLTYKPRHRYTSKDLNIKNMYFCNNL